MDRHPKDRTTDEQIDAAFKRAEKFDSFPRIVEAVYYPESGFEVLFLRLSDGHRLFIPKEMLSELSHATTEQAKDLEIGRHGLHVWWRQLDDGLYLPEFLKHRWGKQFEALAA